MPRTLEQSFLIDKISPFKYNFSKIMATDKEKFAVLILAAGQGKRMGEGGPKVLRLINGRPIISYLIESVKKSGIVERPTLVVSGRHGFVQETLGHDFSYIVQTEQLGTGHAVACAKPHLAGRAGKIIVLYGDMPLIQAGTIAQLARPENKVGAVLSLLTAETPDFDVWRQSFYNFGRIIRDKTGRILAIKEKKECRGQELEIKEVNPGLYCFEAGWLWGNLERLDNKNAQGEYYLTDLVKIAIDQGAKIHSLKIEPEECVGVNTLEELDLVDKFFL